MKIPADVKTVAIWGGGALVALWLYQKFLDPTIRHHDFLTDPNTIGFDPSLFDQGVPTIDQPIPEPQFQPQIIQVPVPIHLPVVINNTRKINVKTDQFTSNVESLLRKSCPAGSLMPDSSTCRANMLKDFPDYAAAWAQADSNLRKAIEHSVAASMNCCCTSRHTKCNYIPPINTLLRGRP